MALSEEQWDRLLSIAKFVGCIIASFGAGWATGVLSDVSSLKAIAQGVVTACAYVLGNQQAPAPLAKKS